MKVLVGTPVRSLDSPYINHPTRIAHLLADTGSITGLATLMAGVLHDNIEDRQTRL